MPKLAIILATKGGLAWQTKSALTHLETAKGGQDCFDTSKVSKVSRVSKVSEVSRVSGVSKMSKQGEQQSLHSLLPLGEGGRRPDEGADVVRSYTLETAKGGQQSLHSFAPWGEGQDEGSYQCNKTDITPHQGRPACTNTLATAKEVRSTVKNA